MIAAVPARDVLGAAIDALAAAGCDTPRLDAELLVADALQVDRGALVSDPGREVPARAARLIGERVRRRLAREPVAYILGRKGFRRIDLAVDARVLIPRPETELLVEVALEMPRGARVHEVGTGSGAVALALRDERPDLQVSASDASPAAVAVARANAERLGLALDVTVASGLPAGEELARGAQRDRRSREHRSENQRGAQRDRRSREHRSENLELVLANLPYVAAGEWARLAPEIRGHEPAEALLAGADGLDAIRALATEAAAGTALALEHAPHQAEAVRGVLDRAQTRRDLAGRERVTVGLAR